MIEKFPKPAPAPAPDRILIREPGTDDLAVTLALSPVAPSEALRFYLEDLSEATIHSAPTPNYIGIGRSTARLLGESLISWANGEGL